MKTTKRRTTRKAHSVVSPEGSARQRLAGWLEQRFLLRFHLILILAFSFAIGLLATRLFLHLGLEAMHWRWPLALLAAYGAFLLALRLWLSYIGLGRFLAPEKSFDIDFPDVALSGSSSGSDVGRGAGSGSGSGSGVFDWSGDAFGGRFGGGGASGDFSALVGGELANVSESVSDTSAGLDLPAIDLPDVGDDGCLPFIILALILALLFAVFGVGVYLVWQAPLLLAEVAFEAAMAAGLVRSVRKVNDPGWVGGALSASWKPFALILLFSIMAAALAEKYAPDARTLPQAIHQLSR